MVSRRTRAWLTIAFTAVVIVPAGMILHRPTPLGYASEVPPGAKPGTSAPAAAGTPADPGGQRVPAAGAAAFRHPGVLVSRVQLDLARQKVAAGAQPWKAAFAAMRASRFASLSWTARPRENVECGSRSNPNHGCSDERDDAMAAYTDALMWYLTGDARYAKKAIAIMDAWSGTIKRHTNHNAPLQTGWSGASFSRAAEIIRYTSTAWPPQSLRRFETMLRTVYLPTVIAGRPNTNGNWELIMLDAAVGIAVFLDDHAAFNQAVAMWRKRLPAYIYLKSDGPLPKPPPGGNKNTRAQIVQYWQGQSTFVDGLSQETCRDFGHTGWGLAAASHVAETARHQGLDLYAEGKARLTAALEFHARYELGQQPPAWLCKGRLNRGLGPIEEVGFAQFHDRGGVPLTLTKRLVDSKVRPAGTSYFLGWETLTHAQNR